MQKGIKLPTPVDPMKPQAEGYFSLRAERVPLGAFRATGESLEAFDLVEILKSTASSKKLAYSNLSELVNVPNEVYLRLLWGHGLPDKEIAKSVVERLADVLGLAFSVLPQLAIWSKQGS